MQGLLYTPPTVREEGKRLTLLSNFTLGPLEDTTLPTFVAWLLQAAEATALKVGPYTLEKGAGIVIKPPDIKMSETAASVTWEYRYFADVRRIHEWVDYPLAVSFTLNAVDAAARRLMLKVEIAVRYSDGYSWPWLVFGVFDFLMPTLLRPFQSNIWEWDPVLFRRNSARNFGLTWLSPETTEGTDDQADQDAPASTEALPMSDPQSSVEIQRETERRRGGGPEGTPVEEMMRIVERYYNRPRGVTQVMFCRRESLGVSTLSFWRRNLEALGLIDEKRKIVHWDKLPVVSSD